MGDATPFGECGLAFGRWRALGLGGRIVYESPLIEGRRHILVGVGQNLRVPSEVIGNAEERLPLFRLIIIESFAEDSHLGKVGLSLGEERQ